MKKCAQVLIPTSTDYYVQNKVTDVEMLGTYKVCSVSLLHPPVSRLGKQGNEEHLVPPRLGQHLLGRL